jgi:hypothetical protein
MRGKISIPTVLFILSGFFYLQSAQGRTYIWGAEIEGTDMHPPSRLCLDDNIFCIGEYSATWPKAKDRIFSAPNLVVSQPGHIIQYYYGYDSGFYPRAVMRSYPYRLEYPPGYRMIQPKQRFFTPRKYQHFHYSSKNVE